MGMIPAPPPDDPIWQAEDKEWDYSGGLLSGPASDEYPSQPEMDVADSEIDESPNEGIPGPV